MFDEEIVWDWDLYLQSFHAEVHQYRPRIEDFNNMTQGRLANSRISSFQTFPFYQLSKTLSKIE